MPEVTSLADKIEFLSTFLVTSILKLTESMENDLSLL